MESWAANALTGWCDGISDECPASFVAGFSESSLKAASLECGSGSPSKTVLFECVVSAPCRHRKDTLYGILPSGQRKSEVKDFMTEKGIQVNF